MNALIPLVLTSTLSLPALHPCAGEGPLDSCGTALFKALTLEMARSDHLEIDLDASQTNLEAYRNELEAASVEIDGLSRDLFHTQTALTEAQDERGVPVVITVILVVTVAALAALGGYLIGHGTSVDIP